MEAGASSEEGAGPRPVVYGVVSGNPRLLCPHEPRLAGGRPRRAGNLRLVLRDLEVTFERSAQTLMLNLLKASARWFNT